MKRWTAASPVPCIDDCAGEFKGHDYEELPPSQSPEYVIPNFNYTYDDLH